MRAFLMGVCAFCLLLSASAHSKRVTPSPLLGRWAVDVARLDMPPDARPRRVEIVFSSAQAGALTTRVEVVDAAGNTLSTEGTTTLDGAPAVIENGFEADASATTMPASNVLVMQLARGGIPASTRVYTVSKDGRTMVETVAYVGADRRPFMRTNHFERVR